MQWASELRREERPLKELWVSTKCGESDTTSGCGANPTVGNAFDKLYPHGVTLVFGETTELTGGEHLVAARCRNDEVRKKFQFMFDRYQEVINRHKTSDLSRLAADQGQHRRRPHHHRGKGARQHPEDRPQVHGRRRARQGRDADRPGPVVHGFVLRRGRDGHARAPPPATWCTSSRPGQGNVIGNPILPVIKLCANPRTVRTMSEHIDVDVSGLLRKEMTPDQAGDKLLECMFRTANGRLTAAEALGHREFVLTRLYESA